MKTWLAWVMAVGFAVTLGAAPMLTDIVSYEAIVIDEASGQVLATGGPWDWQEGVIESMLGTVAGPGRTIVVKCRDVGGQTIFGGTITGADLTVPPSPFMPPDVWGYAVLEFTCEGNTVSVFLNSTTFVGTMVMLPAQDDPGVRSVAIDIKPGSAVNPFNVTSKGVMPVAILGAADLDVKQIDLATVKLDGVLAAKSSVSDVQGDGIPDLVLHFKDQAIAGLLTGVANGTAVELELTGSLKDGTQIQGSDSITVIAGKR